MSPALDALSRLYLCEDELDRLSGAVAHWERVRRRWTTRNGGVELVRRSEPGHVGGAGVVIADFFVDGSACGELVRLGPELTVELRARSVAILIRGEEVVLTPRAGWRARAAGGARSACARSGPTASP